MKKKQVISFARVQPDQRLAAVSGIGSIDIVPHSLVERFGRPSPGDGDKVSGEFIFEGEDGSVFTLYDWKVTDEYNPRLSPDEFWDIDDEVFPMQIGAQSRGRAKCEAFLSWLAAALEHGLTSDQDWLASLSGPSLSEDAERCLLHLLDHGGKRTQLTALEAISRIGAPAATPQVLEHVLHLLHSGQPIRPAAINALAAFSDAAASSWLQSRLLGQLNSQFSATRCNGLLALHVMGPKVWTDAIVCRFTELLLEDETATEALWVMNRLTIKRLGRTAPPVTSGIVSAVSTQLANGDPKIRQAAASAVDSLGERGVVKEILTPLFRMLGEPNWMSRCRAEGVFTTTTTRAGLLGIVSQLCDSVRPEDFQVKANALRVARQLVKATGEIAAGRRLAKIIRETRKPTSSGSTKNQTPTSGGGSLPCSEVHTAAAADSSDNSEWEMRVVDATHALTKQDWSAVIGAIPHLTRFAREDSCYALFTRMAEQGLQVTQTSDQDRQAAIAALEVLAASGIGSKNHPTRITPVAAVLMYQLGVSSDRWLPAILRTATAVFGGLRAEACRALGQIGEPLPEVVQVLRDLQRDVYSEVVQLACAALRKIRFPVEVVLSEVPANQKLQIVIAIRDATGLGLRATAELVRGAPTILWRCLHEQEATKLKDTLEALGARVEIRRHL